MQHHEQPKPPPGLPSEQPRKRPWKRLIIIVAIVTGIASLAAAYGYGYWYLRNPAFFIASADRQNATSADAAALETDVRYLSALEPSRSFNNLASLEGAADYISNSFVAAGCVVWEQPFEFRDNTYRNIICSFGPRDAERLVIGAHYDVHGDSNPGADDNASGVAGILELARLVGKHQPFLAHRLDIVAFTLEEWPAYESQDMGSRVYAASLGEEGATLKLMISVEMIGYYSDEAGSQSYPLSLFGWSPLYLYYPDTADFIGVIGRSEDRTMVQRVRNLMGVGELPVYSINAPTFVPGIDRSDHASFWDLGLPALMVTDTAEYRNGNYHTSSDTPDTLDYVRMSDVVNGLYRVAVEYSGEPLISPVLPQ